MNINGLELQQYRKTHSIAILIIRRIYLELCKRVISNLRILVLLLFIPLPAFSGPSQADYQRVKQDVLEEYPDAEVVSVFGEFVPRLDSLLGYSADMRITFIRSGSSSKETTVWYYHHDNDAGKMIRQCKCPYSEFENREQ